MLSIGRRIERYRILYCWKIMTNLVPNCGISWNVSNSSGVILNEIPTKSYFKTHRMNSFHYVAPRLFNKLPRILRDNRSATLTEWKGLLDEFLSSVPDLPVVPDLVPGLCDPGTTKPSNSLLHWLPHLHITFRRGGYARPSNSNIL